MKATCPSCNAHLNIDDKKIPAGGARIKCPTCQNIFPVKPGAGAGAVPLPGAAQASTGAPSSGAVPLPGGSAAPPRAMSSGAVPLPGGAAPRASSPGAVPLPGAAPEPNADDWEDAPTRMQPAFIPPEAVPGATTKTAPPSNIGKTAPAPAYKPPSVGSSGAVPLPGITAAAPQSEENWEEPLTRISTAPIPSAAFKPPAAPAPEPAGFDFGSYEPTSGNAVPLPGGGAAPAPSSRGRGGAVPLPGITAAPHQAMPSTGSYEPTIANRAPPRASSGAGAVPLPGNETIGFAQMSPPAPSRAAPPPSNETIGFAGGSKASGRGVPLPGASGGPAPGGRGVPLPGGSDFATQPAGRGVPLPGAADFGAMDFGSPPADDGAVPLPGEGFDAPPPSRSRAGGAVPLPGEGFDAPPPSRSRGGGAVPLPGEAYGRTAQSPAHQAQAFDFGSEPTSGAEPAFSDVPEASGSDFAEVPEAQAPSYDAPAPMDFALPPPPKAPGPQPFDFSDLPAPAAPRAPASAAGGFELDTSRPPEVPDNLPSPAGSPYDFAPVPAPAPLPVPAPNVNPSASFGEVDFGGGDSLEFDPTSSKPKHDDLEADLSAPLPPPKPAAPADGLEMLSFIDDTAKEAGAGPAQATRRYHIKRRSGKVFGPFEEAVVVKMLEDGQLLGNEEVSLDSENWQPIGAEAAFQGAIAKLMEQPSKGATTSPAPSAGGGTPAMSMPNNRPPPPSMERLKQLYEGRMAAVAVVQGKEPVPFTKRLPLIAAGLLVVLVIAAGGWSSTTRYGLFGLKVLFPARVSPNTEEFKTLAEAKKGLLTDTFKGYKSAKELSEKLLRTKPYPEVRAVWIQAVYYLSRRYGAATQADLATAQAEQENILLLGEKHVEVVKALANAKLNAKENDKALSLVQTARARADNEGDLELLFLKAEALATKGQVPQAMTDLQAVLAKDKTSAKALHAMGLLHLKQKELDLAAGRFGEALAAAPEHASSAVELAAIELLERKNTKKGTELLTHALSDQNKPNLAPAELGRALAMKATVAAEAKQLDEAVAAFEEALKVDPANVFAKGAYGALLVERHDFAKASPLLKDAVDKAPQNMPYVELYLNSLIGLGKMDEATKVMAQASGRFPGNGRIAFLSGRVEDGMDRTKQAEESYKRAISADPTMVEANIALASLYLRLRRFPEAKPQLEEAISRAPDNAAVHVGLGDLALAENDVDKAQDELNKAADLNPNLPGAFLGLSRVALAKGKPEMAEQQANKALKLDPKIHDGRLQLGTALWKQGKLDDAIKELTQAKEDDPRSVFVPITLGAVQFEKGDLDSATANLLGNALQKEPGNPDANFYMAKVKRKRAEYTQSIELMKKAIDHAPKRAEFHYELGNTYAEARKGNEAVDAWKAALAIDSKYADPLEALGKMALDRNQQKQSIEYFEKALAADPKRTRIFAAIGDAYSSGSQWAKAIENYLKALAAEPGFKEVYPKLANAYVERKKLTDAITWFRKAVAADPNDQMSWYNLGYALKDKKQSAEAIAAFEQFLKLNEDKKLAKEIGDVIYDLKQEQ